MRMPCLFTTILLLLAFNATGEEIFGKVIDSTKEPIIYASVAVTQGGILKGGALTDYDGNYSVKPLEPGYYDVTASYQGYRTTNIVRVTVSPGEGTRLNFTLKRAAKGDTNTDIRKYKKPLIDPYKNSQITPCGEWPVSRPTTQGADLVAPTPDFFNHGCGGGPVDPPGARTADTTGNIYIIDGVEVRGAPPGSIGCCADGATPEFRKISLRKLRYKQWCKHQLKEYEKNMKAIK